MMFEEMVEQKRVPSELAFRTRGPGRWTFARNGVTCDSLLGAWLIPKPALRIVDREMYETDAIL